MSNLHCLKLLPKQKVKNRAKFYPLDLLTVCNSTCRRFQAEFESEHCKSLMTQRVAVPPAPATQCNLLLNRCSTDVNPEGSWSIFDDHGVPTTTATLLLDLESKLKLELFINLHRTGSDCFNNCILSSCTQKQKSTAGCPHAFLIKPQTDFYSGLIERSVITISLSVKWLNSM